MSPSFEVASLLQQSMLCDEKQAASSFHESEATNLNKNDNPSNLIQNCWQNSVVNIFGTKTEAGGKTETGVKTDTAVKVETNNLPKKKKDLQISIEIPND